jgi:surface antigen
VPDIFAAQAYIKPTQTLQPAQLSNIGEMPLHELDPVVEPVRTSNTPNEYPVGQCTWGAKQFRPDIPNHLGNADQWYYKLKSMGWPVGTEPRAGAIGQSILGMHVVYIVRVNPDGTVYLAEYNWDYHGSYRERTAPASSFLYIY